MGVKSIESRFVFGVVFIGGFPTVSTMVFLFLISDERSACAIVSDLGSISGWEAGSLAGLDRVLESSGG